MVTKIASHGYCLKIWLKDALKEVPAFLLITWTHFKGAFRPTHQLKLLSSATASHHPTSLNRALCRWRVNPELIIYKKCEAQVKRLNINRKGLSTSYIYSLWQQLDFFYLYIFKKKGGVRESHGWKKCGRRDFRGKGASLIERSPIQHWGHRTPEQKK